MSDSVATSWTVAHRDPLSVGFPRQEHWSGLPFASPEDLTGAGIKNMSPVLETLESSLTLEPLGNPQSSQVITIVRMMIQS